MPSANTFKYQTIWTKEYQKSNWAMPVYPVIADMQFKSDLQIGDTVKRRYRTNPIFANDLGADGSYTVQYYVEGEESFTISKQKEATVRVVKPTVLHTDLDTTKSYGVQLSNAIWQEIEGDTLYAAVAGAGTTMDAGNFGGTSGEGLTASIANIADIPVIAMEIYRGKNVVIDHTKRFGKLPYEDYGGMKTWIMPPQLWTIVTKYMIARVTTTGDSVTANGYNGRFGEFECFIANTLPYTARLALSVNPTDGDTITIKGVTITFKGTVDAGTTAGQVKIASTVALTNTNLAAFLNAPGTTVADATNAGYNSLAAATLAEGGYTTSKANLLHGLVATADATGIDLVGKGWGKQTVSSSFTSGSNSFTTAKQCVQSLFVIAKNVCLAIRQEPEFWHDKVDGKVAENHVLWTVYDNKVFIDQARAIIKLSLAASGFTSYSNVHA